MISHSQVLILGGGLAGLSFAIAIACENPDLDIVLLEASPFRSGSPNPLDTRGSALNLHSVSLLESWGIWSDLRAAAGAGERARMRRHRDGEPAGQFGA